MKRSACLIGSLFLFTGILLAQQPNDAASKEEVRKLFDLMHSQNQVKALFEVVKQQTHAMVPQLMAKQLPNATPQERAKVGEFVDGLNQKMLDNMPIEQMIDAMIPAYQHHFTHSDVEQLTQFYSSPTGQKLLTQLPSITSEAMQAETPLMQKWMSEQMTEVQKSTEEFCRTLRNQKRNSVTPKPKAS